MPRRDDHDADWTAAADGTLDRRVYYCQNWRADVVALLDANGAVVERVRYGPYGTPHGGSPADLTGPNNSGSDLYAVPDGDADTDDDNYYQDAYNNGNADIADITGGSADGRPDGSVTSADFLYWNDIYAAAETLGRNRLSRSDLRNRRGYAGYAWDPALEAATPAYHVRNRVLMPETGRWSRRDPLGYVDGQNLYQYVMSEPKRAVDPQGLVRDIGPRAGEEPVCGIELRPYSVTTCQPGWVEPPEIPFPRPGTDPLPRLGNVCHTFDDKHNGCSIQNMVKNDPHVQRAIQDTLEACGGEPGSMPVGSLPVITCDHTIPSGEGYTESCNPNSITIGVGGNPPDCYQIKLAIIHELRHIQQSCNSSGCDGTSCDESIKREVDAYDYEMACVMFPPGCQLTSCLCSHACFSARASGACDMSQSECRSRCMELMGCGGYGES